MVKWQFVSPAVLAAIAVLLGAGCSADDGEAACPALVTYHGERYSGHGGKTVVPGDPAGFASRVPCDDGHGGSSGAPLPVYELREVGPELAIAVELGDSHAFFVSERAVDDPPPELVELMTRY